MTDWVHISIEVVTVLSSLVLSVYCFKLWRFFKGGFFQDSFRIFGFAALLFALGHGIDVVLELTEIKSPEFGLSGGILHLAFVVVLSYGMYSFYKAWTKLRKR